MWLTKDVLLTQLTIQQQITLLHSIVLLHFLHKACADACVNFLNTSVTDGGSVYFSSRTQTKRIGAIVPVTNYSLTGNYEYSLKTLNIDCCVLTLNLNEIKTNINHMLALQQTLLDPLLMQTDSWSRWRTLTPFIPINLNFKCCGIICENFINSEFVYAHRLFAVWMQGVRPTACWVIVDLQQFALQWK